MTERVKEILSWYAGENPGVLTNIARMLNHGRLAGTGRLVICSKSSRRWQKSSRSG